MNTAFKHLPVSIHCKELQQLWQASVSLCLLAGVESLSAERGGIMCFAHHHLFFSISSQTKSLGVNFHDESTLKTSAVFPLQTLRAVWAGERCAERDGTQSDGFRGEDPRAVSSSSSLSFATVACAWLRGTMQPSAAPQEL